MLNKTRNRIFGIVLTIIGVSTVLIAGTNMKYDSDWLMPVITAVVTTVLGINYIED